MKKLLSILTLLTICPFATADILEGTTSNVDFLLHTNYSESAVKIIDSAKAKNNYGSVKYEQVYVKQAPRQPIEHVSHWYEKAKDWFDPMQDDGYFGHHEINYENKFFQMEPDQNIYKKKESL